MRLIQGHAVDRILELIPFIEDQQVGHADPFDNAPAESFFGTLKTELVNHAFYQTRMAAMTDIFFYIEGFYNRTRRHTALDYLSPEAFEAAYAQYPFTMSFDSVSINPG